MGGDRRIDIRIDARGTIDARSARALININVACATCHGCTVRFVLAQVIVLTGSIGVSCTTPADVCIYATVAEEVEALLILKTNWTDRTNDDVTEVVDDLQITTVPPVTVRIEQMYRMLCANTSQRIQVNSGVIMGFVSHR
jgi:hypothetical protein